MKKKDKILVGGILLCALCMWLCFSRNNTGNIVHITLDGEKIGSYSLAEEKEIPVESVYGYNIVCIKNGQVFMKEANCPDQYCVNTGKVDSINQTIVCLPHKLIVEVEESKKGENQIDAITR